MPKQKFSIIFKFNRFRHYLVDTLGARVGGFVEAIYNKKFTYRVDFRLSGGFYYGWTIIEMAESAEGIKTLMWILEKDFPPVVQDHIRQVLRQKAKEM